MSSLILENLMKQASKINFDFSKSYKSNQNQPIEADIFDLPLEPKENNSWVEHDHDNKVYLEKIYKFHDTDHIIYFVKEVLSAQKKAQSDVELFIKNDNAKVFICSLQSTALTYQEVQLSKFIDEIYDDIFYLRRD